MTERVIEGEVVGRRAARAAGPDSDWLRWQRSDVGRMPPNAGVAVAAYAGNAALAGAGTSAGIDFYV
jgi:hypothetical protein